MSILLIFMLVVTISCIRFDEISAWFTLSRDGRSIKVEENETASQGERFVHPTNQKRKNSRSLRVQKLVSK